MAKNLNVSLAFTANASQAKAELNALKKSLNELVSGTALKTPDFKFTKDIQDATRAAAQLKIQLDSAMNVKTGNLDLTKFSESMAKSGMSLEKYQNQLYQLGPAGEKAFADLTRSITMADVPLKRSNKLLSELWTTMKNTARWQLTSSAMHGFMGAVQSAYGYAQDLNASLNEIRIVTGASTDKMAEFAKEANSAAKALSTTTTNYTNASLIFYQQGLTDSQVKERTDITIKMANAAGASAEKVSDQLTAVWNNFYDGSKSLEYYADVMTALGAATASSTDEISEGLQKFAAVADTVGLSYEYATAALATITSNTRESADVVGNALKTLFARIQGLQLGETLEDGTDLNKYSQALDKVGISIYDANGGLKTMDDTLNEMAAKWNTLSNVQQTALAQAVAGVRQYTQLIALMENWNNGDNDSMVANLQTVDNASGALQEQADIYADSWEASSKRVKASLEAVYSSLLNDKFFIGLNNGIADVVDGVKTFINSLGGVKGLLLAIGSIVTNVFSKQIAQSLQNAAFSLKGFFNPKAILEQEMAQKKKANELLISGLKDQGTTSGGQSAEAYQQLGRQQLSYIQNAENMSQEELEINQILMDRNRLLADQAIKAGENLQKTEEKIAVERKSLEVQARVAAGQNKDKSHGGLKAADHIPKQQAQVEKLTKAYSILQAVGGKLEITADLPKQSEEFQKLKTNVENVVKELAGVENLNTKEEFDALGKALGVSGAKVEELYRTLSQSDSVTALQGAISDLATAAGTGSAEAINALRSTLINCTGDVDKAEDMMREYLATIRQFGPDSVEAQEALNKLKSGVGSLSKEMDETKIKPISYAEAFTKASSAIMAVGQAINTIRGIIDTFRDEEASDGEKILALVSGIGMLIPAIVSFTGALSKVPVGAAAAKAALTGVKTEAEATAAAMAIAQWQITLIALAIAAIAAAIYFGAKAIHKASPEGQFEAAAKAAEKAADAASAVQAEYEEVINTIEGLDSGIEKIHEMEQGTLQWRQAIIDSNSALIELLSTYGMLSSEFFNTDENGLMTLNEKGREKLIEQQSEAVQNATSSNFRAQVNKNVAESRRNASETAGELTLLRDTGDGSTYDALLDNSQLSADVGIAIADTMSQGILNSEDLMNADKLASVLSDVTGLYEGEAEVLAKQISTNDELISSFNDLGASVTATAEANRILNNQIIETELGEKIDKTGLNEKAQSDLVDMLGNALADQTNKLYKSEYKDGKGKTDKDIQKEYAEAMGWDAEKTQNKAGNKATYYDKQGNVVAENLSDVTARQFLAQQAVLDELNISLDKYYETLQRINETGKTLNADVDVSELMSGVIGGKKADFGDANETQINALKDAIDEAGTDYSKIISDKDAKNMGYQNAKAYVEALKAGIENYNEKMGEIGGQLATSINKNFLEKIPELTLNAAESMSRNLTEAFTTSGKETANLLDEIFIKAGDHADELSSILENVDWGDPNVVAKLNAKIKEQGLNVDTTSEAWINYVEAMAKAGFAIGGIQSKFESLRATLITVKEAIDGLTTNDIISDETYAELLAINPLIKDLFIITEDGYKFIGGQEDLSTLLTGNIKEKFGDVRQGFEDIRSEMETIGSGTNWFNEDGSQAFSSDRNVATIAQQAIDNISLDSALAYLGVSEDSLREASDYILKFTDSETGEIKIDDPEFNQEKYDEYLNYVKDFYSEVGIMQQEYANGGFSDGLAQELTASQATSIEELNNMVTNGDIDGADSDTSSLNAYEKQLQSLISTGMQAATTIGELQTVIREGEANGGTIDYNQYADALIRIGSGYDSVTQEVEAYQAALRSENEEQIDHAAATLEASIRAAELGEQYDISAEEIENYAEELKMSGKYMEANEKALVEMAKDQKRFDKAVISASKNMSKWKKDLDVAQETGHLVSETATEMAEAYGNLLDIDPSSFSQIFLQDPKNLENMKLALEGNEEAYKSLQAAAKEDIAFQIGLDTAEFDSQFNDLMDKYWQGKSLDDIAVGASLDNEGFLQGLTDMVNAAGMTAQQATDYLSSMGVDAEVINEPETVQETVGYNTIPQFDYRNVSYWPASQDGGAKQATAIYPTVRYNTYPVTVPKTTTGTALKVTSASKSSGGAVKHSGSTPSHGGSNSGGGGGGGGGGGKSSTPAEKVDVSKPSDFGERYHTINKQIDNMGREMERASKAADKLWSRKRLKYLEEQNKMLDEEIALLQEKTRQAEEYLEQDKNDLNSTALDLGFTISYGTDGEILNYDAIRDAYAQQMIAAQQYMNTLSTKDEQDAYDETVIEPLQKKIDAFEEAMGLYYESLETIQENADLIQEKLDQKLQNNFDMWAGELELDIAINERDLELLEYYLGKIEDDAYQMAEAAALMVGSLDGLQSGNFGGQLGEYLSQLDTYNTKLEELNQKLAAGEITEAAYEEGLETIRSGLLDNLQAVQELDNAMLEYYSNTLDAVMEEMDKYTEKLEHQTSILEHYANMMEILGKSYDYRSMGEILEGQVKTLENELKVAEAEYDLYKSEAEEKRKLYEEAVAAGNVEAAEVYKKEWEAAEAAAMEAQSEMLDKTEAWAEAMRAVVENNLKGLSKTLEESLTGGTTFDQINLQLERAASLQEEYLTTTNKIYETNKLMRKAQQEIDKSSNTVAKQRLKDFIKETNQLQDKSKLSKYELEIQQAKYDLLLAQLALEDAQNAKSTVRLQRDSEGNFGYVYTADQNKLAEAQQALEDAQNSLYNIGLEGANDYTEKYAETMQEMYDTLTSITEAYFNGEIASQEEYEAQMLAAQQYYYEQLENYQDLYGIALQTDTRVIKDAWSTGMQIMTIETSDWKNAVKEYTNDATKALVDWYAQVDAIANKTGLDNIANKVKQITDESDKLKDKILGTNGEPGVIQALADELTAVSNLTGGYANLRATLQGLIEDYEELMRTVVEAQNTETPIDSDTPNDNPDVPETEITNTEDPTSEIPEDTDPATTNPEDVDAPILKKGDSVTVKSTATHFSRNGGNGTRMRSFVPGSTYSVMDFDDDEVMIGRNGVVTGWVKKTDLVGFNTGGYTGSWGPYGKLAILDEKELVLNQGDTANFLASMEVLERILEMLDVQSASAQLGGLLSTPIFGGNNTSSSIEQNVHIEASFPSVTDRNEIEEAFNNLINTASQYANRKI